MGKKLDDIGVNIRTYSVSAVVFDLIEMDSLQLLRVNTRLG